MRSRSILVLLAIATLVLAACGGGGDSEGDATTAASEGTQGGSTATPSLDDGVAAVVNGSEIPADLLEQRVEAAAASPEVAAILEGEDGEAARGQLQASVLSQLIVNRLVLDGAEERGIAVDDDAIDATREELATEAGGQEAFDEQVEQAGLDEEQLRAELEAVTALRLVRDDLQEEAGATPAPSAAPQEADAGDALLQQWLLERLSTAEIAVAPEVGTWDPSRGTVIPPGAPATPGTAPEAPAGDPTAPTGNATAPTGDPTAPTGDDPAAPSPSPAG